VEQPLHNKIVRLVDIEILEGDSSSELAFPTIVIPKKNGKIRMLKSYTPDVFQMNITFNGLKD